MRASWLAVLGCLLLVGCGPVGVGVGLSELFKDETDDPLAPRIVELRVQDPRGGDAFSAPRYASSGLIEFEVEANKQVRVFGSLVGPDEDEARVCTVAELEAGDTERCIKAGKFVALNRFSAVVTEFDLDALAGARNEDGELQDGEWFLFVRIRDAQGRQDELIHRFTVDKTVPEAPVLVSVEALVPRAIDVTWIPSIDPPSKDNDEADPSEVVGYIVSWEESDGIEVPSQGFEEPESVFVPGRDTSSFRITDLCAGRLHRITVTAVDAAGREGQTTAPAQSAPSNELLVRTRMGGDGTFEQTTLADEVPDAVDVEVSDLDEDGIDDLVIVAPTALEVHRGKAAAPRRGDGTFERLLARAPPSKMTEFRDALVRDLDGDRIPDIVALGTRVEGSVVAAYFGDGAGAQRDFLRPDAEDQFELDGAPSALVPGARPSFAVVAEWVTPMAYPTRGAPSAITNLGYLGESSCAVLVDHNGDSFDDLTVCVGNEIRTILGPNFGAQSPFQAVASAGGEGVAIVSGFFNEDAFPDLAIAHGNGTVSIILGAGPLKDSTGGEVPGGAPGSQTGLIQFQTPVVIDLGGGSSSLAIGDFDSDGVTDIAVARNAETKEEGTVTILFGNRDADGLADGTFSISSPQPVGPGLSAIAPGDFNDDGVTDLVLCSAAGPIHLLLGNGVTARGNGTFSEPADTGVSGQSGLFLEGVVDADRDGIDDLFGERGNLLRVLHGRGFAGQGNGKFEFGRSNFWHRIVTRIASADLDGDGWFDFVASSRNSSPYGHVEAQRSTENGFERTYGTLPFPAALGLCADAGDTPAPIAADYDGDGVTDLLLSRSGVAAILYGRSGSGLTDLPGPRKESSSIELTEDGFVVEDEVIRVFHPDHCTSALAVARLDRDARPDLASFDLATGQIRVLTRSETEDTVSLGLPAATLDAGAGMTSWIFNPGSRAARHIFKLTVKLGDVSDDGQITVYRFRNVVPGLAADGETIVSNKVYAAPPSKDVEGVADAAEVAEIEGLERVRSEGVEDRDDKSITFKLSVANRVPGESYWLFIHNESGDKIEQVLLEVQGTPAYLPQSPIDTQVLESGSGGAPPLPAGVKRMNLMLAEDFNLDGLTDLLVMHPATKKVAVVMGKEPGAGSAVAVAFEEPRITDFSKDSEGITLIEGHPISVRSADVNADGVPDLIGLATNPVQIVVFLGEVEADGRPKGTFVEALPRTELPDGIADTANSLVVGDFNSDGIPDVAIGTKGEPIILLGRGELTRDEDVGEPGEDD